MATDVVKYNPAFLSDDELISGFVARQADFDIVMRIVRENASSANQHVMVIGQRGSGKTMLALRVAAEVRRDAKLKEIWYPLVLSEENYEISNLGEFWLQVLFYLGQQTGDDRFKKSYDELRQETDDARLRDSALSLLLDFADARRQRILLVVENFNTLLGSQLKPREAWALRHTMLNEPRIMILATATSRFKEIDSGDKAMFDLFRVLELRPLGSQECLSIWHNVTKEERAPDNMRPIQILTGGSPRLLAILSSFASRLSFRDLMSDLVHLIDEHTEYFKSHLDGLPVVERKVYVALCELWDPATASKIGKAARINTSKASALLRRLIERGAVVEVEAKGKAKVYQVAERMYNIYYLMRRQGSRPTRINAIIGFMTSFYGQDELIRAARLMGEEACQAEPSDRTDHYLAYEALLKRTCDLPVHDKLLEAPPAQFFPGAPEYVRNEKVQKLLQEGNSLRKKNPDKAESAYREAVRLMPDDDLPLDRLAGLLVAQRRYPEAEQLSRQLVSMAPDESRTWANHGVTLRGIGKHDEAKSVLEKAIQLDPRYAFAWHHLGHVLSDLKRPKEAEEAFRKAIELDPKDGCAWHEIGRIQRDRRDHSEAEASYRKTIELKPTSVEAWGQLGLLLLDSLHRAADAEKAFRKVVELDPKLQRGWLELGRSLVDLDRPADAESAFRQAIRLHPKDPCPYARLGNALNLQKKYAEAMDAYRRATELGGDKCLYAWERLGSLLEREGRCREAEQVYRDLIRMAPKEDDGHRGLARVLLREDQCEEAVKVAENLILKKPGDAELLNAMAWEFYAWGPTSEFSRAEEWARGATALAPEKTECWYTAAAIFNAEGRSSDALDAAKKCVLAASTGGKGLERDSSFLAYVTQLLIEIAAGGQAQTAIEIIESSSAQQALEPLLIGLRLFLGEKVNAAAELLEVGKDVAKRIRECQQRNPDEVPRTRTASEAYGAKNPPCAKENKPL
jgi:tetratricopeptide (TPR) repeat protein